MATILVTGGAGYIGSVLVPRLLSLGHSVTVLDRFFFGTDTLAAHPKLRLQPGDIRDIDCVESTLPGHDAVIHLAAISNDPCSDLSPELTRAVNLDAVEQLMTASRAAGVKRFLYASSASVYGIKEGPDVTEDMSLNPITIYAECKARGEAVLNGLVDDDFVGVSVRAATVCGFAPRLRLDLTINILSYHAITNGRIRVFGGSQMRPNIHIQDLVSFFCLLLDAPAAKVNGRAFNASRENRSVMGLAEMIRDQLDPALPIDVVPTDDIRSYQLSAQRAADELGFVAQTPLTVAVAELKAGLADGRVPGPGSDIYHNVALMKADMTPWLATR